MTDLDSWLRETMNERAERVPHDPGLAQTIVQRGSRQRRRQITAGVVGGVIALVLAVPAAMHLLPHEVAPPAGQEDSATGTDRLGGVTPGMTQVTAHSQPVTATHTGTTTVHLGDRPSEATAVSITLECLSAGEFTWPDDNTMICDVSDAAQPDPAPPYHVIDLAPGQDEIVIEAPDGASWRITTTYVHTELTPWGVNAKGETYGIENENGTPDLTPVTATNGRFGYVYTADLKKAFPEPTSPEDALAQQEANKGKAFSVPVYEPDGETRIGEVIVGDARSTTNGTEDPPATTTIPIP